MSKNVPRNVAISGIMQSLRRIFKAIQDYSQEVSHKFGITGPQLWALKTLSTNGSLPLGQLSKMMYLHPSTITGVVDRLEKKGYVVRDRVHKDRRVVMVQLTTKGKKTASKAPNPIQGKMIYGLNRLKQKNLNSIYDAVEKLMEIAEAQNIKATFFFDKE
ncbi:MAG: MarR family transcriptional regulator [Thermodesulfobacteriota bacterium]|jgi:DNA-binding MarR family transcriptional regulator